MDRKRRFKLAIILLASFGSAVAQTPEGDAGKGKEHFAFCVQCHGENGQGMLQSGAPQLAGQHAWYVVRQLQNFRAGIRGSHEDDEYGQLMRSMAKTLPDEQAIKDVAAYVAGLDATSSPRTESIGVPTKGKEIFNSCQACHGEAARGNETPGAPRLAGQHDWYLIRQLKHFKFDVRGSHEQDIFGQSMRSMAYALLPDEKAIHDVVAYIKTLK